MTPRRVNQCELNTQRASIINSWKENYSANKKQDGKMSTRAGHLIVMTTAAAVLVLIGAALVAHCHYGKRTQYHEQVGARTLPRHWTRSVRLSPLD